MEREYRVLTAYLPRWDPYYMCKPNSTMEVDQDTATATAENELAFDHDWPEDSTYLLSLDPAAIVAHASDNPLKLRQLQRWSQHLVDSVTTKLTPLVVETATTATAAEEPNSSKKRARSKHEADTTTTDKERKKRSNHKIVTIDLTQSNDEEGHNEHNNNVKEETGHDVIIIDDDDEEEGDDSHHQRVVSPPQPSRHSSSVKPDLHNIVSSFASLRKRPRSRKTVPFAFVRPKTYKTGSTEPVYWATDPSRTARQMVARKRLPHHVLVTHIHPSGSHGASATIGPANEQDATTKPWTARHVSLPPNMCARTKTNRKPSTSPIASADATATTTSSTASSTSSSNHQQRDQQPQHRLPRKLTSGFDGSLNQSQLRHSVGKSRMVLNTAVKSNKLGQLHQTFLMGVIAKKGKNHVSHLTLNARWNDLPQTTNDTLEFWLGEGPTRLALALALNPGRQEQKSGGIPVFWAVKLHTRHSSILYYIGHYKCIRFEEFTQLVMFKGKPRQALIEMQFRSYDEALATAIASL